MYLTHAKMLRASAFTWPIPYTDEHTRKDSENHIKEMRNTKIDHIDGQIRTYLYIYYREYATQFRWNVNTELPANWRGPILQTPHRTHAQIVILIDCKICNVAELFWCHICILIWLSYVSDPIVGYLGGDSQCKVYNYIKLCLRAPESHLISTCISIVYFALTVSREVSVWYCVVLINLLDSLVLPSQLIPLRHAKPVRNHCIPKKLLLYSLFML